MEGQEIVQMTDEQAEQMNDAVMGLVAAGMSTVGVENTLLVITGTTKLILENPKIARKMADPETQAKLMAFGDKYKGKSKPSIWDMGSILSEMADIFN